MARPRKSPVSADCVVCGKNFSLTPPEAANKKKTCSRECFLKNIPNHRLGKKFPGIGGSPRVSPSTRDCVVCGTTFYITPRQHSNGKSTCSSECYSKKCSLSQGGLAQYVCEMCGVSFEASRHWLKNGNRRFCGNGCRHKWFSVSFKASESPHWQGGQRYYYGPDWKTQRKIVLGRDNNACQFCGAKANCIAHIIPFRDFGIERHKEANNEYNLMCLCRTCHNKYDYQEDVRT